MENESKNIQNLRAIMNRFSHGAKKSLQVGLMSAALLGGTTTAVNAVPSAGRHRNMYLTQVDAAKQKPYSKTIGGTYTFHNFIGEAPEILSSTAKDDVNRCLKQGITYLQCQFAEFNQSLAGRTYLQRYFAQFNIDFNKDPELRHHRHREITDAERIDYIIQQISDACNPIFGEMARYAKNDDEREALTLCCRALANENYKEALGDPAQYNQERNELTAKWQQNKFLRSTPIDIDLDRNNCRQTSSRLYTLLHNCVDNMRNFNPNLQQITITDLQRVIDLSLNASALSAMHDYTAEMLHHAECLQSDDIREK